MRAMNKKIVLVLLIIIVCLVGVAVYFLWSKGSKTLTSKLGKKEYRILYSRSSHDVFLREPPKRPCNSFLLHEYLGGGIVKRDGTENKILEMEGYSMGELSSKKYDNYYYISASSSPVEEKDEHVIFNFDIPEQTLWSADFKSGKSKEIKSPSADKFPSAALASFDNKYLVYLMTNKKKSESKGWEVNNPYLSDSDLIIRDIKSGNEQTALTGNYNRQLFYSFSNFSSKEDAFYTIARDGESFKFVKIMLDSGKVIDFNEVFPEFDWSKIDWGEFFSKEEDYVSGNYSYPAHFSLSPDETKLLIHRSTLVLTLEDVCINTGSHKIWLLDLKGNTTNTLSDESGLIDGHVTWKSDSQEFAFIVSTAGGCYPDYIDSTIYKMDRDGKNKEKLVSEQKSRINSISWSPDGKEIIYAVYNSDLVSFIRSVEPETKIVKEIINTEETEGSINKERPVVLVFIDWVASK